ncbi:MobA/MobL family protein, partial [Komagataeibacter europaeus]|uniref:MobA/MobL family protein n=1 Tax=Komagataeibacter europaeus TaxID=33995 RepID=UPI00223107F4
MEIGRLSMKVGGKGKACAHSNYIERQGKYAYRLETGERLVATGSGNMPEWAQSSSQFWKAADEHERANWTTYREMEIALPRELDDKQKEKLVREWVKQEIGYQHAYTWAIHSPRASDGGEQPHVHMMFSERMMDGHERGPEQFFKRYNGKAPEKGGAKKANTGKHPLERKEELKDLRHRWEIMCNRHLRAAECRERVSLKPNNEVRHGEPEPKMLPSEWQRGTGKADIVAFREARKEQIQASHDVRVSVRPTEHMEAELIHLAHRKQVDQRQAQAAAAAARQAEADRRAAEERQALIAKLPAMEKAVIAEIEDETNRRFDTDFEYQALWKERERHEQASQEAGGNADKAERDEAAAAQEAQELAQKHTIQTRLHRSGFKTFMPLAEAEQFRDDCK